MSGFILDSLPEYQGQPQQQAAPSSPFILDSLPEYTGSGQQYQQAQPQQPATWRDSLIDAAKTVLPGMTRGAAAVAGLPGFLRDAVDAGANYLLPLSPEGEAQRKAVQDGNRWMLPNPQQITGAVEDVTGPLYKPNTTTGKYVNSVAETAPAVMAGPGSLFSRVASALGAGIGSEAAGQATEGTKAEPYARIGGAMVGGALPNIAGRAITPLPISQARKDALDTLEKNGVTSLTAGQKTGSVPLRYAESFFGDAPFSGGKAQAIQEQGQQQYTKAATSRAGMNGLSTPPELQANQSRLGSEFDRLSNSNTLNFDPQFAQDLRGAIRDYANVPASQQKAMVQNYVSDIVNHATTGQTMPGPAYQEMRSRLSRQSASLANSDPTLSNSLKSLRNALDDAMGRSISPQDQAAWQAARQQYGAQKVLENAASKSGQSSAEGYITPQNLRTAVASGTTNRGAYARGQGQFADLARAGNVVMTPLPNSGTAQRHLLEAISLGAGGGGIEALMHGVSPETAAVAAAGMAGPGMIGRALFSNPMQAYLSNQLVGPASVPLVKNAQLSGLVRALLQSAGPPVGQQAH